MSVEHHEILLTIDGRRLSVSMDESWALTIGRDAGARIPFPHDPDVSTHHASLAYDRRGWWIEDRDSRNGTLLEGVRLRGRQPIREGHTLQLPALDGRTRHVIRVDRLSYPTAVPTRGPDTLLADLLLERARGTGRLEVHLRLRDETEHRPAPPLDPRPADLLRLCLEAGRNLDGTWRPPGVEEELRLFGGPLSSGAAAARNTARKRLREWWAAVLAAEPTLAGAPEYAELITRRESALRLVIEVGRFSPPGNPHKYP